MLGSKKHNIYHLHLGFGSGYKTWLLKAPIHEMDSSCFRVTPYGYLLSYEIIL